MYRQLWQQQTRYMEASRPPAPAPVLRRGVRPGRPSQALPQFQQAEQLPAPAPRQGRSSRRARLPSAWRNSVTTATMPHHQSAEAPNTPPTVAAALAASRPEGGASAVKMAAKVMMVGGLASVAPPRRRRPPARRSRAAPAGRSSPPCASPHPEPDQQQPGGDVQRPLMGEQERRYPGQPERRHRGIDAVGGGDAEAGRQPLAPAQGEGAAHAQQAHRPHRRGHGKAETGRLEGEQEQGHGPFPGTGHEKGGGGLVGSVTDREACSGSYPRGPRKAQPRPVRTVGHGGGIRPGRNMSGRIGNRHGRGQPQDSGVAGRAGLCDGPHSVFLTVGQLDARPTARQRPHPRRHLRAVRARLHADVRRAPRHQPHLWLLFLRRRLRRPLR